MWIQYSDPFSKTWTKGYWPQVCWDHMCDSTQESLCPSPTKIHHSMWIQWPFSSRIWTKGHWPKMTFDPKSVEVTCVNLPKDHCVQVPQKYIKVCGYNDPFLKNLNQRSLTPRWPLTSCLPKDHHVQVPWEYINACGYSDQFCKIPHTYYIHTHTDSTYYVQNEWSIVSYWTQFRWDKKQNIV